MISWIDNNLILGSKEAVTVTKQELMSYFECEYCGECFTHVGCELTGLKGAIKFTQDVLMQS